MAVPRRKSSVSSAWAFIRSSWWRIKCAWCPVHIIRTGKRGRGRAGDAYTIEEADRAERGTDIVVYLNDDAKEFLQSWTLKNIVRKHSDYIAFPIYVG